MTDAPSVYSHVETERVSMKKENTNIRVEQTECSAMCDAHMT